MRKYSDGDAEGKARRIAEAQKALVKAERRLARKKLEEKRFRKTSAEMQAGDALPYMDRQEG